MGHVRLPALVGEVGLEPGERAPRALVGLGVTNPLAFSTRQMVGTDGMTS